EGIDVSYYQGAVSWPQVKTSGRAWAIARVSYGIHTVDTQFANNWPGMRHAGLYRGTYQFFLADQDPIQQADLLLSKVNASGGFDDGDLPPVLDVESTEGQTDAVLRERVQAWLDRVEHVIGRKAIVYTA